MREEVQKLLFLLRRGGKVTHTGDPSLPIEGLAISTLQHHPSWGPRSSRPQSLPLPTFKGIVRDLSQASSKLSCKT